MAQTGGPAFISPGRRLRSGPQSNSWCGRHLNLQLQGRGSTRVQLETRKCKDFIHISLSEKVLYFPTKVELHSTSVHPPRLSLFWFIRRLQPPRCSVLRGLACTPMQKSSHRSAVLAYAALTCTELDGRAVKLWPLPTVCGIIYYVQYCVGSVNMLAEKIVVSRTQALTLTLKCRWL